MERDDVKAVEGPGELEDSMKLIRDCLLEPPTPLMGDYLDTGVRELAWCDVRLREDQLRIEFILSLTLATRVGDLLRAAFGERLDFLHVEQIPHPDFARFTIGTNNLP